MTWHNVALRIDRSSLRYALLAQHDLENQASIAGRYIKARTVWTSKWKYDDGGALSKHQVEDFGLLLSLDFAEGLQIQSLVLVPKEKQERLEKKVKNSSENQDHDGTKILETVIHLEASEFVLGFSSQEAWSHLSLLTLCGQVRFRIEGCRRSGTRVFETAHEVLDDNGCVSHYHPSIVITTEQGEPRLEPLSHHLLWPKPEVGLIKTLPQKLTLPDVLKEETEIPQEPSCFTTCVRTMAEWFTAEADPADNVAIPMAEEHGPPMGAIAAFRSMRGTSQRDHLIGVVYDQTTCWDVKVLTGQTAMFWFELLCLDCAGTLVLVI